MVIKILIVAAVLVIAYYVIKAFVSMTKGILKLAILVIATAVGLHFFAPEVLDSAVGKEFHDNAVEEIKETTEELRDEATEKAKKATEELKSEVVKEVQDVVKEQVKLDQGGFPILEANPLPVPEEEYITSEEIAEFVENITNMSDVVKTYDKYYFKGAETLVYVFYGYNNELVNIYYYSKLGREDRRRYEFIEMPYINAHNLNSQVSDITYIPNKELTIYLENGLKLLNYFEYDHDIGGKDNEVNAFHSCNHRKVYYNEELLTWSLPSSNHIEIKEAQEAEYEKMLNN